jgi:hypothetical protein
MEPKYPLLRSVEPATGPYPNLDKSSSLPHNLNVNCRIDLLKTGLLLFQFIFSCYYHIAGKSRIPFSYQSSDHQGEF